jgi:hypothetical protein
MQLLTVHSGQSKLRSADSGGWPLLDVLLAAAEAAVRGP